MKKNIFRSLIMFAACVFGNLVFTSCSGEDLEVENLSAECVKSLIVCDNPAKTAVLNTEGEGTIRRWTLSDGQTVTARHTGNIDVDNIEIVDVNETPGEDDNTTMVNVVVASKSRANTITRSVSYAKMVKATPEPPIVEPTITREYFVADTTMRYTAYNNTSKMFRVFMDHRLAKVSEWSDGRKDTAEVWNKSWMIAQTFFAPTKGRIYSTTAAKDITYKAKLNRYSTEESKDDAFTLNNEVGNFLFDADYVCDAKEPQRWNASVGTTLTNVTVSYEGYNASYTFDFTIDFVNRKEENRGIGNEVRNNHEYVYETTTFVTWNISLNGQKIGTIVNELEVFHF